MSETASVTIDFCGLPCPAPLLGIKKILDDLPAGQTLCLLSDCPGTHDDLFAWCKFTGNTVMSVTPQENGKVSYLLRKADGAQTTPIPHATLDMRGVTCPGPIVEAKRLLEAMKSGEVLQLITDCAGSFDDIRSWSQLVDIELLAALPMARGAQEFYLKKR